MSYLSTVRSVAGQIAGATGYPRVIQAAINAAPVSDHMSIADSASVDRGVRLSGDITLNRDASIRSGSVLRGDISLGQKADVKEDVQILGDVDIADQVRIRSNSKINGKISIGERTNFGGRLEIIGDNIDIGRYNAVAREISFLNRNHLTTKPGIQVRFYEDVFGSPLEMPSRGPITVGHDVWIGMRSIFLTGVSVGCGSIIGAGSVVTDNVEPYEVVAGTPAKHIGWRFDKQTREQLLDISWWGWDEQKLRQNASFFETDLREVSDIYKLIE